MRLTRWQVDILAFEVARELLRSGLVKAEVDPLAEALRHAITDDLMVEEKLDEEVAGILKTHAGTMRAQGVDYATMFDKVKKQLVRERKLVL
mgnify:CR=1 FL=1